jgi:DNA polymerase I-like protein with 3'-5' exonuclease and polymerase domains
VAQDYTIVTTHEDLICMYDYIEHFDELAYDTETTGLNVRKDKVIGFSISGEPDSGFYFPLYEWNGEELVSLMEDVETEAIELLEKIAEKNLIMHNASFDCRITKNHLGVDLLPSLVADTVLMKHTVDEEPPFGLKEIACLIQKELGLDVETAANQEQIELKANIKANGGSTTKTNYELYKADMPVIGKYACFVEKSSLVSMEDGSTKWIEDVEVGDKVISHTGASRRVYATKTRPFKGYVYDIEVEDGRMIQNVTEEHPFLTLNEGSLKEEWVKIKDLKKNTLLKKGLPSKGSTKQTYDFDFWWMFGLYQADGYVRIQKNNYYPVYTLHQDEAKHLTDVLDKKGYSYSTLSKKNYLSGGVSKAKDIVVCDSNLGKLFLELSGGKYKSYDKRVSKKTFNMLKSNPEEALHFVSGIFDGDGHFKKLKGKINCRHLILSQTSPHIANLVDIFFGLNGINCTKSSPIWSKDNKRTRYDLRVSALDIPYFNNYLRIKKHEILDRDSQKSLFKKYVRIKRIVKKEYVGEVHNISVEKDESYISNGLVSHNCKDTDLTFRLFEYYYKKLEQEELLEFFFDDEVMPLYKEVTIKMEDKGILLDIDLIEKTKVDIEKDMEKLESMVVSELKKLPQFEEWLSKHLDSIVKPTKGGLFGQKVAELAGLELPKTKTGKLSLTRKNIEKHCPPIRAALFLMGDAPLEEEFKVMVQKEILEDKGEGLINIASKKQLGDIVFNYLKIPPLSFTEKGNPQFNDSFVEYLSEEGFEWAFHLSNYNKLNKIKGAYINRFLDQHEDGYFYPRFMQHKTISGRYGSDLQQLPRAKEEGSLPSVVLKYNNVIRKFFIAEPERCFIDSDYESLEPHIFSHVSSDEGLKNIFRKGHDFYSTIAIATEKIKGVSADKKADNYLGATLKELRQKAKAYSLGIPYGMRAYALSKTLGISKEEAQTLIDDYLNAYPDLKKWMRYSENFVKYNGWIKIESGRIRHLPKVKELFSKHGDKLMNPGYRKKLEKKLGKKEVLSMYMDYKNGLNNSKNVQIQGLSASIVNRAMIMINREFDALGIDAWVCCTVHDQIIANVPAHLAEQCRELVQDIMENNYKISIRLKAPAEIGQNFYEAH